MTADDVLAIYAANAIFINVIVLALFLVMLTMLRHGFFALIILLGLILYFGTHAVDSKSETPSREEALVHSNHTLVTPTSDVDEQGLMVVGGVWLQVRQRWVCVCLMVQAWMA